MTDFNFIHFFLIFVGLILVLNVGYYILFWVTSFFFAHKLIDSYLDPNSDTPDRDRAELLALAGLATAAHSTSTNGQAQAAIMEEDDDVSAHDMFEDDEGAEDLSMDFLERQRLFGDD